VTDEGDSDDSRQRPTDSQGAVERGIEAVADDAEARAAAPDPDDLDIPLPWNTVSNESDDEEAADEQSDREGDGEESDVTATPDAFEDLRFVGPKTGALLRASDLTIEDLTKKRVAYRDLKEAGVNPGVAAKIRREHSLSWSLDGGGTDLGRRSSQVRGLDDDERAWIADSSGWSESGETEADGSGDAADAEAAWRERTAHARGGTAEGADENASGSDESAGIDTGEAPATDAEAAWRQRSAPTPLTAIDNLDTETVAALREAGIGSVRRLATASPESVADALDVDVDRVTAWCRLAREHDS
jgi:hypothetical protein